MSFSAETTKVTSRVSTNVNSSTTSGLSRSNVASFTELTPTSTGMTLYMRAMLAGTTLMTFAAMSMSRRCRTSVPSWRAMTSRSWSSVTISMSISTSRTGLPVRSCSSRSSSPCCGVSSPSSPSCCNSASPYSTLAIDGSYFFFRPADSSFCTTASGSCAFVTTSS